MKNKVDRTFWSVMGLFAYLTITYMTIKLGPVVLDFPKASIEQWLSNEGLYTIFLICLVGVQFGFLHFLKAESQKALNNI